MIENGDKGHNRNKQGSESYFMKTGDYLKWEHFCKTLDLRPKGLKKGHPCKEKGNGGE